MPPPPDVDLDESPTSSPELLAHDTLPEDAQVPEVSMVEETAVTGVTFSPELWMQRRQWALQALRKEGVRSVLDLGCGAGALLETLMMPASTVYEPPIRPARQQKGSQLPSPVDSDEDGFDHESELFINRLGGIDASRDVIAPALSIINPQSSSNAFPPPLPRWEPLSTELWLGGLEKYNAKLEGYDSIVALEVIEHLDPNVLSRFGVVTLGTYRPRLMLVSTPNFDFNAKFPRAQEDGFAQRGFVDPTGRTQRVFRHSDHKIEMTGAEFRTWAETAAADWGYEVEVSGVGTSSHPSFYPPDDKHNANQPIFASQTAIFRMGSGMPLRSPRSVRTTPLPFMPASKESSHPHKLAGRFSHPRTAPGDGAKADPEAVRAKVREFFGGSSTPKVSLEELWGVLAIAAVCGGSKRWLVGSLGGWGDCAPLGQGGQGDGEFEVTKSRGDGLSVKWTGWEPVSEEKEKDWGTPMEGVEADTGKGW
ncbi:hypothetical protein B9479_005729 [Cryptococcus floricola]|uniref:Small RNA 2'-O-methyltransferase n=1 Tax=Cryptococcus floricola TaxID=2591691 RepID=A0A5D3AS43_9TREE|nr:hypothetical protein B9479_005729 [Cryptococcus floricola]